MIQIRIHGRGGQGVVTAAELVAIAAFNEGKYTQAFPVFGVERTGAPIQSFVRISDQVISTREQIYEPDILIIQDQTLLTGVNVFSGSDSKTQVIINSALSPAQIYQNIKKNNQTKGWPKLLIKEKNIFTSPATEIALEIFKKNLVNTVILGALARYTKLITLASIKKAIAVKFADKNPELVSLNMRAALKAFSL
ncbi:MAG: 2-oxoacid:acceptor oxidoreductase family protein [Candidatus Falkowbacteria bacterium]|nr:2-oxoacid:acceptor oxidoreductase family protein [Candidatus Falkowbacteria bacterium]